jgi:PAS domain S-box-containing protein
VGHSEISGDIGERTALEAKYRSLLEAVRDAMVIVDANGSIVLVNAATTRLFGYERAELIGRSVEILVPTQGRNGHSKHRQEYMEHPRTRLMGESLELRGLRKDTSEFPAEIMLSPLETVDGALVTAAIRDISVRKDAENRLTATKAELKRSNDELAQFAYIASHDLQEPLRMVASYTQLLAERYKGRLDCEADEFIAYAIDGATRMQGMMRDLLTYSRVGMNCKALGEISSEHGLQQALTNLQTEIEASGAVVTHDPLPVVTVDPTQLTQVFQNLVGNAIKYRSAEIPHIHVSVTNNTDNEWLFAVQDNGLGIEPKYFDKIFVLFQRLHRQQEIAGAGIGLAICKKMVERLGGRIWVESQPGKGSTFHFALPGRGVK